jgi:hypothetical protein
MDRVILSGVVKDKILVWVIAENEEGVKNTSIILCGNGKEIERKVAINTVLGVGKPFTEYELAVSTFNKSEQVLKNMGDLTIVVESNDKKLNPIRIDITGFSKP